MNGLHGIIFSYDSTRSTKPHTICEIPTGNRFYQWMLEENSIHFFPFFHLAFFAFRSGWPLVYLPVI